MSGGASVLTAKWKWRSVTLNEGTGCPTPLSGPQVAASETVVLWTSSPTNNPGKRMGFRDSDDSALAQVYGMASSPVMYTARSLAGLQPARF